jgi:superfamily I DNA/RNA helicase
MRVLVNVIPTPQQIAIVSRNRPGVEIIKGAAGSGKTTTALLRLRSLIGAYVRRVQREETPRAIRVLVLTYNTTLRGYIEALTNQQLAGYGLIDLTVSTFAKWAKDYTGAAIARDADCHATIAELGRNLPLAAEFVRGEVEYVMGRFPIGEIDRYLDCERTGRGPSPRIDRPLRTAILETVIKPYYNWLVAIQWHDWNSLAVAMCGGQAGTYDVIIADEVQDFSANQIRAIIAHLAEDGAFTMVLDTAQRIYARGFQWQEVGLAIRPENVRTLDVNYRNTRQIARFAAPLLTGVPNDGYGAVPDPESCTRDGPLPVILRGRFRAQCSWAIDYIRQYVNLDQETVAFLHPKGWGCFAEIEEQLKAANLPFVHIAKVVDWPDGHENIALSTLHSAKGLEFNHVIMIGLNAEMLSHGAEADDDQFLALRRLLAMGIGRARDSVVLGYKPEDTSDLFNFFVPGTYNEVNI